MSTVVRTFMPFMPPANKYYMYALFLIALIMMGIGWYGKIKLYHPRPGNFFSDIFQLFTKSKIKNLLFNQVLRHQKLLRDRTAGIMHLLIFWSMVILVMGTCFVALDEYIFLFSKSVRLMSGRFYVGLEFMLDLAGLMLMLGIVLALGRRLVNKTPYLSKGAQPYFILVGLGALVISGFTLEGMRLGVLGEAGPGPSFIGALAALLFNPEQFSQNAVIKVYQTLWWFHVLTTMFLIAYFPYTNLAHMILVPLSLAIKAKMYPEAKLSTPFKISELAEQEEEVELKVGISEVNDLNFQKRIEIDACVNCGRCARVCPAVAAGRKLSPQRLIQEMKSKLQATPEEKFPTLDPVTGENCLWSCTNCSACSYECPSAINHVEYVLDLRRYLLNNNQVDDKKIQILRALDNNGNPYGVPSYKRAEWLADYGVENVSETEEFEYVYWLGCLSAYDQRSSNIARSMIEIFRHFGIKFAVLGAEEKCCGETAKRLGEEGRFQMIALENIELLNLYNVKKIITHCPHCFNTLKHEYPEFGGHFEVIHHSEFLANLLKLNSDGINRGDDKIIFHDPCNLSRLNNIMDQPRYILSKVTTNLAELKQACSSTFCCGAGGGNNWYSVEEKEKISHLRLKQLLQENPDKIAVACPYCLGMLEDANKILDGNKVICDVAELVSEKIKSTAFCPETL